MKQYIYIIKDNENPGNPRLNMVSRDGITSLSVESWFWDKVAFELGDIEAIDLPMENCGQHLHLGDRWMLYIGETIGDD